MKSSLQFKAGVILTIAILFITFSFYGYQVFFTPNFLVKKEHSANAYLYISKGSTFNSVVDSLIGNDIINDHLSFSFVAKVLKYQEAVKPGRYKIHRDANNIEIVKKLKSGNQAPLNLTFNNVRTKRDLAEILGNKLEPEPEELMGLLNDHEFAKNYGLDTNTIMALFIPNTYEFFWTASGEEIFERMHKEYQKFWNEERLEKAKKLGLTPEEVMTLASIVEAETNMNPEKPTIAGVYLNRLQKGWMLQADPTVKFALQDFAIRRITFDHIKCASPYNTYKYPGLPPGPINLPSIPSIEAVLNHEKHNYMFFVADHSSPGYHRFSENFQQHVAKARKYRNNLDKRKIY